jgi:hypothetical protein
MAASDLCNLADLKAWINMSGSGDDQLLSSLITSVSRTIYAMLSRDTFVPASYTEIRDGNASDRMFLREWPVISVSSLTVNGYSVPAAPALVASGVVQGGWLLEAFAPANPGRWQRFMLRGTGLGQGYGVPYKFTRGLQNVTIAYNAGFQISGEAYTAALSLTAVAPMGPWLSDVGVTYANGTALTKVASSPAVGQYSVQAGGVYTFNVSDVGQALLISYGYVPADINNAVMTFCAERYKYRDRVGMTAKSIGGQETAAYSIKAVPDYIAAVIQPYKRVVHPE